MALDLSTFRFEEVLSVNEIEKSICVAGNFTFDPELKVAILKLSLPVPTPQDLLNITLGPCVFTNSMFSKYQAQIRVENPVEVIYPATKEMYLKHLSTPRYVVRETREVYREVVKPYIDSVPRENTQWVRNIVTGASETENVKYRDPDYGFLIALDYKLQSMSKDRFYFLCLPGESSGLKSLRDLRGEHLPMLRKMRDKGTETAGNCVGASEHQVLAYVHYYPSFYYFHVHFTSLEGFLGNSVPRAHLLDTVISNIEMDPNYYEHATLLTMVKEVDPYYEALRSHYPSLPAASVSQSSVLSRLV